MKHDRLLFLLAMGLMTALVPGESAHAERTVANVPTIDPKHLAVILDHRSESADRQVAMAAMREAADAGNSYAMYNLGSLARQARFKDDPIVRHDPGAALMWLTRSFDAGRLTAAFKIAVVHRELGDSLEAMGWLQVYTYYMKGGENPRPVEDLPWLRRGHVADLMAKLQKDLKGVDDTKIRERTIALLQQHGSRFDAAPRTPTIDANVNDCRVKRPPKGFRSAVVHPVESSLVEIVAVVDAGGSARNTLILDSVPDAMTASGMRQYGYNIHCPAQENSDDRHVFLNWNFVNFGNSNRIRR